MSRDIDLMRTCNQLGYLAPIKYCKTNKGYHYTDPDYSIDKLPLNTKDIKALEIAATTLGQYKYLPLMQEFTTIVDKIIRVVNRAKQTDHGSLLDFIYFEKTPISTGITNLDPLINAIQNREAIEITYQKFKETNLSVRLIHPYFLKEYRNRWYLIGLDDGDSKIKTFGLERILEIASSKQVYKENKSISKEDFFKNGIGISFVDQPPSKVVLWFNAKQSDYIKTQSLHSSQKIITDDPMKGLTISLNIVINYELIGVILSYGSDVKVIEPESLATKLVEISNRVLNIYN